MTSAERGQASSKPRTRIQTQHRFSYQMNSTQTVVASGAGAARAHIGASRVCGTRNGRAGQRATTKRARHAAVAARARGRVAAVARLQAGPVSHQARALRAVSRRSGRLGRAGVGYTQANVHATCPTYTIHRQNALKRGTRKDAEQCSAHRSTRQ